MLDDGFYVTGSPFTVFYQTMLKYISAFLNHQLGCEKKQYNYILYRIHISQNDKLVIFLFHSVSRE